MPSNADCNANRGPDGNADCNTDRGPDCNADRNANPGANPRPYPSFVWEGNRIQTVEKY